MTVISDNRKARHNYRIEHTFEAGVVLRGWEVKSLRAGRGQLAESYVVFKGNELFLLNAQITPLITASTHVPAVSDRTRKLLLKRSEIDRLVGYVKQKGYTIVPLNLHWTNGYVKIELAIAKGKNLFDKRQAERERSWQRERNKINKLRRL